MVFTLALVAGAYAWLRLFEAWFGRRVPRQWRDEDDGGDTSPVIAVPCPLHGEFDVDVSRVVVDRSTRPATYEAHCPPCAGGVALKVSPADAAWLLEVGATDAAELAGSVDAGLAALAKSPWGQGRDEP